MVCLSSIPASEVLCRVQKTPRQPGGWNLVGYPALKSLEITSKALFREVGHMNETPLKQDSKISEIILT